MKKSILSLTLLGLISIPAFANYVPGRVDVVATCSTLGLDHGYQVTVTQVEGVPNSFKARVSTKTIGGNRLIDEFELAAPRYYADGIQYVDSGTQGKDFTLYADSSGRRPSGFEMDSKAGRIRSDLKCSFPVHILRAEL